MSTTRRPKWHPQPPPTPRILNLPRRTRRRTPKHVSGKSPVVKETECRRNFRGKLENLFDQERTFSRTVPIVLMNSGSCERRDRVEELEFGESGGSSEEEKWKFQAEILRAECNFLRMEREVALKKLERNRAQMEKTLRSAVETLICGRKKIYEGKSVGVVLEAEIEDLAEKLDELQRSSNSGVRDSEVRKCSNFDKQASILQKRLEKLEGISEKNCVKEIREMAEASLTIDTSSRFHDRSVSDRKSNRFTDVEILRRKMEGLSKGMLERMEEEYGSMLSTGTSSAASSASTSRRIEFPDSSSSLIRQPYQETIFPEEKACSGLCKAIVRRIMDQVRSETEQWSQMQNMLEQVREDMEELQASRDFWEERALNSDDRIHSLHSNVQEWRQKACSSETKVVELQKQVSELHCELEKFRTVGNTESTKTKGLPQVLRDSHMEKEKRVLICRLKENQHNAGNGNKQNQGLSDERRRMSRLLAPKRSPLQEIANSAQLLRQSSRAVFPLYHPEPSQSGENL